MSDDPESAAPPEVSVVIPVRNGEAVIAGQLAALARQDFAGPWELVVSDNGSTDGTRAVVEAWRDRLPALTMVDSSAQIGVNFARNTAVGQARADRILFADADDEVTPGWVTAMAAVLSTADLATGPAEQFDDQGRDLPVLQPHGVGPWLDFLPYALGCNLGVRRATFDQVGGFDETWPVDVGGDDYDFSWRAQLGGAELGFSEAARIRYRQPATLGHAFRKQWHYGVGAAVVARRFEPFGAQPWTWRDHVRDVVALGRDVWWLGSSPWRIRWVKRAGWTAGRLRGQLRRGA